jgi:cyclopropane-fatty-acyl-phospholipid synthase
MKSPNSTLKNTAKKLQAALGKKIVFRLLGQLDSCQLKIYDGDAFHLFGSNTSDLKATVTIEDQASYAKILHGGSVGAAEAYILGMWNADNLVNVIRIFSRNLEKLEKFEKTFGPFYRILNSMHHLSRSNSKSGSAANISAHYDLSQEMYKGFLDPHMQYSSAVFPKGDSDLEEAQRHKMQLICQKLELEKHDHLLEIGSGWGGFACFAAKNWGCDVTTTTISKEQFTSAKCRIKEQGLQGKVNLLFKDYRDLYGEYSKVVSVEMIEAVGKRFLPIYFSKLNELLSPGGRLVLQCITMNDQRYKQYCNDVDFIQKYIFPGGHLPSLSEICKQVKKNTNFCIVGLTDYREHYAKTLKEWRQRFLSRKELVHADGLNEDFIRLWEYYFSYCEGGFRESAIGIAQLEAIKNKY